MSLFESDMLLFVFAAVVFAAGLLLSLALRKAGLGRRTPFQPSERHDSQTAEGQARHAEGMAKLRSIAEGMDDATFTSNHEDVDTDDRPSDDAESW